MITNNLNHLNLANTTRNRPLAGRRLADLLHVASPAQDEKLPLQDKIIIAVGSIGIAVIFILVFMGY